MTRPLVIALLSGALLTAPGCRDDDRRTLTVFAAGSLTESFERLARAFEAANPDVRVECNFAGSQQLLAQLRQGARADVFASANRREMDGAIADGLVDAGAQRLFAHNRLVVIVSNKGAHGVTDLAGLAAPDLKLVLADPSVPIGGYTQQMLQGAAALPGMPSDFAGRVAANVVSREQNVKAVLAKVRLGEADGGVVYATDVTAAAARDVRVVQVPEAVNPKADYPIAPLRRSGDPELADRFIAFVRGPQGRQILSEFGFATPTEPDGR